MKTNNENFDEFMSEFKTETKRHTAALKDTSKSWLERVLRKIPPFKAMYEKQDALVFYTTQLANLTYSLTSLTNTQQEQISLIAKTLLNVTKASSADDVLGVKKKQTETKLN
jgi:hypothetical protein